MTKPIEESRLVDLTDDQLRDLVGYLWESIKATNERMNADPKLQRMIEEIAEYKETHYKEDERTFKAKLKAARKHAQVRGLNFQLPDGVNV